MKGTAQIQHSNRIQKQQTSLQILMEGEKTRTKSRIEVLLLFLLVSVCDFQFQRVKFYNEQYSRNVCRTRQLVIRLSKMLS